MSIEVQRRELQRLYIAVIAADGMSAVHRLLSAALIEHRRTKNKTKPKAPKREPVRRPNPKPRTRGPSSITWRGETLELGPAMRGCTTSQQLFVLAMVHDGLPLREAEKAAGYSKYGANVSATITAAIAEERARL